MSSTPRTVVLGPAAELEHRRLADEIPGFEEAYAGLVSVISANPRRGWPSGGDRWGYALAKRDKPRVRAIYTFDDAEIRVIDLHATPAEYLPSGER